MDFIVEFRKHNCGLKEFFLNIFLRILKKVESLEILDIVVLNDLLSDLFQLFEEFIDW